jgi:hypothetical protein
METEHLEDVGVNGWIILKWILKRMGWIHLAQYRDEWRILVK